MSNLNSFINRVNIQQYRALRNMLSNNLDLELSDLWTRIEPLASSMGIENFNDLLIISRGRDFEKYELELVESWNNYISQVETLKGFLSPEEYKYSIDQAKARIDNIYLHVLQSKPLYE